MYNEYFGLEETPFSIAPDPRYLYMSEQHREALAHLLYGFNSDGGFVLLTGEVGTGKTTVCRCLLEQIPENAAIAFILNPKLTVEELLATICDEFGITYPEKNSSIKIFTDLINRFLLESHAQGRKAVLIIDEAQNLSADVLEQLRLLTNLETNQVKLLQIILLGQPELRDKLARPELVQLSQRIIARYHLGPLSRKDVAAYVSHRLAVAGLKKQIFPRSTIDKLFGLSKGVPRVINLLCDRSLLGTFSQGKNHVTRSILGKAAREVFGETIQPPGFRRAALWIVPLFLIVIFGAVVAARFYRSDIRQPVADSEASVVVAPPAAESIKLDVLEWPRDATRVDSEKTAYADLFSLWGTSTGQERGSSPCQEAVTRGLLCYSSVGSMNTLRQLNRPAVLKLYSEYGIAFHATLRTVKPRSAVLSVGAETKEVSLQALQSRWLGEYTLLWRPPPNYRGYVEPGRSNLLVPWLHQQLAIIQGREPEPLGSSLFSDELVRQVKQFQLSQGLIPDGIVGIQTLILLNSAAGEDVPRLLEVAGS